MKERIVYMGTPEFAVPALQKLLDEGYDVVSAVCQPDRPVGRHMRLVAPPVKQLAKRYGIPVLQPEKVRTGEFEQQLRDLKPGLIVTAAYGRILPAGVLAVPEHGCLNIHASLLPAYRGAAPIQWCLIRGETETGITIMLMDEGMDTGPILAQERIQLSQDMDAGTLSERLAQLGADLLPSVLERWLAGEMIPRPQDPDLGFAIRPLKREDGRLDWSRSAEELHNRVRGLTPWPGAFSWCGDKRLKIHRTRVCTDPEVLAAARGLEPGTICLCGVDAISVACGSGVVDLLEIQSESGRRMHCRDCAHNYRLGQTMGGMN